ncbi:MAG: DUF4301 family protein [Muribaculaceae bacterium]|nr:DUF4301 family protein [Muribaculaceae bacterium]
MLTEKDLEGLRKRGITTEQFDSQMQRFATGFPYLKLQGSARPDAGIHVLDEAEQESAIGRWERFLADGGRAAKFVPASGAASRMFKALFAFADGDTQTAPAGSPVAELADNLDRLPFRAELDAAAARMFNVDAAALVAAGRHRDLVSAIIRPEGMNYGALPKALLTFHSYEGGNTRTSLEEQLYEGVQTVAAEGRVDIHFTVSADHRTLFEEKLAKAVPAVEAATGVKINVSLSEQKPSTDTPAAALDGTPFRNDAGEIVFRPGGHGALIENLNDLDATVVFIKNIDNVVPEARRADTLRYKRVLGGVLMQVHDSIRAYVDMLASGDYDPADLAEIADFMHDTLCITAPELDAADPDYMLAKLDRPLRVCGMVRNEGEPGGGPYLAYNPDGSASPQILESTQINTADPEAAAMMASATHFNPVDLVCYIRDLNGDAYDLREYVDPDTGFISSKSFAGRELRALELPGLWNGAMSDWNTVFVEVPASTFNPVKVVNDLLRPAHQ